MVYLDVRPPRIHDIEQLGNLVVESNEGLAKLVKKSKNLTRFAVTYRYPDTELRSVSFPTIKNHVKMAKAVYDFVVEIIPTEG